MARRTGLWGCRPSQESAATHARSRATHLSKSAAVHVHVPTPSLLHVRDRVAAGQCAQQRHLRCMCCSVTCAACAAASLVLHVLQCT